MYQTKNYKFNEIKIWILFIDDACRDENRTKIKIKKIRKIFKYLTWKLFRKDKKKIKRIDQIKNEFLRVNFIEAYQRETHKIQKSVKQDLKDLW